MKIKSIIALFLALITLFTFVACSATDYTGLNGDDPKDEDEMNTPAAAGKFKLKFLKVGKSPCVIIRTQNNVIVIDAASEDQSGDIIEYLAEKEITTIDYLILSNFSKSCIGGVAGVLKTTGFTVKNIYEPTYTKESRMYTTYRNAVAAAGITPVKITDTTITVDDLTITFFTPQKDYSTADDENDEGNSVAVSVTHGSVKFLYTSRVMGDRVTELIGQLDGKTYDLITVPNYGRYDDNLPALLTATAPKYAVIFASNTNPPASATESALTSANVTYFVTRNGGVEAQSTGSALEIKQ